MKVTTTLRDNGKVNQIVPFMQEHLGSVMNLNNLNKAMPGKRNTTEAHWQTIRDHGFSDYFVVDLMDEDGSMKIAAKNRKHIKYDIVGKHLPRYDYMINLAHFKGHQMGDFGGVLKNASIGVASSAGKAYIHSAGATDSVGDPRYV